MGLAEKIVAEITEKVADYEQNQQSFLNKVNEWGDLFSVRKPRKTGNGYSNPRLTEFHRAATTLGSMMFRMQTAQDPYFDTVPMSPVEGSDQLLKIQGTLEMQMQESQFKRHLLVADTGVAAFGTQIVQEDYSVVGVNSFGRRVPVTTFFPRSLLQVAFERGATDIDSADWLTTSDLISNAGLMRLGSDSKALGQEWHENILEHAAKEEIAGKDLNQFVLNKLNQAGFMLAGDKAARKELLLYYGKLDCINDGVEYICGVVSRKHLAKFEPNKNQHGKRNFRVGYWVEDPMTLDPYGLGIGGLLGDLHKQMDANRQKVTDNITMSTYNMMYRLRTAGIDDNNLKIRPLQIIDMDEKDGMGPLPHDMAGAEAGLKLEELLRQEFMNASGATPTLQAQITEATASEVALSQNEAVRNISVKTEIVSEQFIRQHLLITHSNNVAFIKKPLSINTRGVNHWVYPRDFAADVDFKMKLTTDKDYKPKRLESMVQTLGIITSTKSQHPELQNVPILPLVQEIYRGLGVPADSMSQGGQGGMPMGAPQMGMLQGGMPQMTGGPEQAITTPVGQVMGSPQ